MPLKISYLLMRWLFWLLALVLRSDLARDAAISILRLAGAASMAAALRYHALRSDRLLQKI